MHMAQQLKGAALLLVLLVAAAALKGVAGMSILACYSTLQAGQYLQNGDYWLVMQADCNLVLYKGGVNRGKLLWQSDTTEAGGGSGCDAYLAGSSHLEVRNAKSEAIFSRGPPTVVNGNYAMLDATGNLSIRVLGRTGEDQVVWQLDYPPLADINSAPEIAWGGPQNTTPEWNVAEGVPYMVVGYSLYPSRPMTAGGLSNFQLNSSCYLQLQYKRVVTWERGNGGSGCRLVLQDTGALQILLGDGTVSWEQNYTGKPSVNSYVLYLSDNGDLSVFDSLQLDGRVWSADWGSPSRETSLQMILWLVAGVLVTSAVCAVALCVVGMYFGHFSACVEPIAKDPSRPQQTNGGRCSAFSFAQIRQATDGFTKELGKGGFGTVYYGKFADGQEVAVKDLSAASSQGQNEFRNEIRLLSVVHHKCLVSLVGYCSFWLPFRRLRRQLLVYEYMSGGDLQKRLHGEGAASDPLTWKQRTTIILQVAEGLEYLHHHCKPAIIHRDIKGPNVLLDENMDAKVADFGLSKLVAVEQDATHITTTVKGTVGYLDPEYYTSNRLTEKSDVYSFGVLLMEILTGKGSSVTSGEDMVFVGFIVRKAWKLGQIDELADPHLRGQYEATELSQLISLALRCVKRQSSKRPSMSEVVQKLRDIGLVQLGPLTSLSPTAGVLSFKSSTEVSDSEVSIQVSDSDISFPSSNSSRWGATAETDHLPRKRSFNNRICSVVDSCSQSNVKQGREHRSSQIPLAGGVLSDHSSK